MVMIIEVVMVVMIAVVIVMKRRKPCAYMVLADYKLVYTGNLI